MNLFECFFFVKQKKLSNGTDTHFAERQRSEMGCLSPTQEKQLNGTDTNGTKILFSQARRAYNGTLSEYPLENERETIR